MTTYMGNGCSPGLCWWCLCLCLMFCCPLFHKVSWRRSRTELSQFWRFFLLTLTLFLWSWAGWGREAGNPSRIIPQVYRCLMGQIWILWDKIYQDFRNFFKGKNLPLSRIAKDWFRISLNWFRISLDWFRISLDWFRISLDWFRYMYLG